MNQACPCGKRIMIHKVAAEDTFHMIRTQLLGLSRVSVGSYFKADLKMKINLNGRFLKYLISYKENGKICEITVQTKCD
jgi:hypothetical protein